MLGWFKWKWTFTNPRKLSKLIFWWYEIMLWIIDIKVFLWQLVYLLKYTPSALLGVLALLSSFATLPLTFIELSSYTGVPSKNVKVDQDLRVGKEKKGKVLNLNRKNTMPTPSKTCVVALMLTLIAYGRFPVLSCPSLRVKRFLISLS